MGSEIIFTLKERINKLNDWKKGYLTITVGFIISTIIISGLNPLLMSPEYDIITNVIITFIVMILGIISGYVAKREFLKTYTLFIITYFAITVTYLLLIDYTDSVLPGDFGILAIPIVGIFASIIFSLILLPSLLIGLSIQFQRKNK